MLSVTDYTLLCARKLFAAGLDLIEVLEELPAFTAGYAYSLVSNTFVQRADGKLGTKHLMVLGIPQVTNSIRKHGASLANAIVKAVIRLLTQQIGLLSQASISL